MVGEPKCGLSETGGTRGESLDVTGSVEQRVLGMDV